MQRIHFFVHGYVQGVYFRVFTVNSAKTHGLTGWVRNLENGKVEGEAQGTRESLELFLKDLDKGPPAAHVVRVDQSEISVRDGEEGFRKVRWGEVP